jgi:hypothetical protein
MDDVERLVLGDLVAPRRILFDASDEVALVAARRAVPTTWRPGEGVTTAFTSRPNGVSSRAGGHGSAGICPYGLVTCDGTAHRVRLPVGSADVGLSLHRRAEAARAASSGVMALGNTKSTCKSMRVMARVRP